MIDAANPGQAPWLVHPREQDLEYFVEHYSGVLLILTTAFGGKELSLATAPVHSPCKRQACSFLSFATAILHESVFLIPLRFRSTSQHFFSQSVHA